MKKLEDEFSLALQTMQENLKKISDDHQSRTWLQEGKVALNENLRGDKTVQEIAKNCIEFFCNYLNAPIGTFYLCDEGTCKLQYAYGIKGPVTAEFKKGEGFIGRAVAEQRQIIVEKIPKSYFSITSSSGKLQPNSIVIYPVKFQKKIIAVIELAKMDGVLERELHLIKDLEEAIALALNSGLIRQELEIQAQLIELANDAIMLRELNTNKIMFWNAAAEREYGWTKAEALGKQTHVLFGTKTSEEKEVKVIEKQLFESGVWSGELRHRIKSKTYITVSSRWSLLKNKIGEPIAVLEINTNVSEQKELQKALERQSSLIELANDAILLRELSTNNIQFWNNGATQCYGWTNEEVLGKPSHQFLNTIFPKNTNLNEIEAQLFKTGKWEGELKHKTKNKGIIIVLSRWALLRDSKGRPEAVLEINTDVSIQKKQQNELQQLTEELKAQQEELQEANIELEAQTQKLQASDEELRVQQEELIENNKELREKGALLEERTIAIQEKNEELLATSNELSEKAQELEQASKYKSEFLSNMSHELRTPLNSILLLSRLLADNHEQNLTDDQIEFAKVIHNAGNGLLDLINEILDLSKIEAGKMDMTIEEIQTRNLMKELGDMFIPLAKEKNIELKIEETTGSPKKLKTDKVRIGQVLKNLLSNALKFTEKGHVILTIREPKSEEHKLVPYLKPNEIIAFEVRDSGIGIAKEKHNLIFEAFQQADGSTRRQFGGTGLGLSISKQISHLLGGNIYLKSEPEKGSVFTLVIPINAQKVLKNTEKLGARPNTNKLPVPTRAIKVGKPKTLFSEEVIFDDRMNIGATDKIILVIEDDVTFAKALLQYIHQLGYKVIVGITGEEGIKLAQKYLPLGILLDIQLPKMNGWKVMEELKENLNTKHIPVHMMSSLDVSPNESISSGAIDFIPKPIAQQKIKGIIERIESIIGKIPKQILVVDHNKLHSKAIKGFIESREKHCILASSAKEAFQIMSKEEIDCIVLDMGLPDVQGYEFLEKIKSKSKFEKTPIIVYTGKSLSVQEEQKLKKYASTIIVKTANSFQRLSNEVSLFLHLVEERKTKRTPKKPYLKDKILSGKRVLIVDDDSRNILSLSKLLQNHDMKVVSAVDGGEALEILEREQNFDLILMDMMMPVMDGFETTSMIKQNEKLKNIPIIAVTAKAMLGDREKCLDAGANDYITKPVDIDQLLSLLRVWLYK